MTPALRDHYFRHRSEWLPSECCEEHRNDYVRCRLANRPWVGDDACCKARRAFDKRTPGLFKVEWSGDGFVGLCSKTYYCFGDTDKYSTKGLSKRHNTIDKDAFLAVLTNRRSGSGSNRGFRVHKSTVLTYVQERAALAYFLRQTRVARGRGDQGSCGRIEKAMHAALVSYAIMDARWKHPFTCIVAGPTGCGKSTFGTCMLRHAAAMIDPEKITRCYGEWKEAYATTDLVHVRFEVGLPTAAMFESTTRNLIVIDDLMAETDERVTTLFTKKVTTGTRPCCISYRTCSLKTKRVVPSV